MTTVAIERKTIFIGVGWALMLMMVASSTAWTQESDPWSSDNWPTEVVARPLTLGPRMFEIRGDTISLNLSSGNVFKPLSLAPDIYFGVFRNLTIGLVHETGLCLTGSGNGCPQAYNDIALDIILGNHSSNHGIAFHGGFGFVSIDSPFVFSVTLGMLARLRFGPVAIVFDPSVRVGLTDTGGASHEQEGLVNLPFWVQVQVMSQLNLFMRIGLHHSLHNFGDHFPGEMPFGVGATFAINSRIDVGAEFYFPMLAGEDGSANLRRLLLRAAFRI